jgi:hypothetical protein
MATKKISREDFGIILILVILFLLFLVYLETQGMMGISYLVR